MHRASPPQVRLSMNEAAHGRSSLTEPPTRSFRSGRCSRPFCLEGLCASVRASGGREDRASAARLLATVSIQDRIGQVRADAASDARAALSRVIPDLEQRIRQEIATGSARGALKLAQRLEELTVK